MNPFTIIDNIVNIPFEKLIDCYNSIIRLLRVFLRSTTFAIDSTIIETKPNFPGCGKTKRINKDKSDESPRIIYGFKLFSIYEVKSRMIVAIRIVPVNESDHNHFLPLVEQAVKNCSKKRIKTIIMDRGFLDGSRLWKLKYEMGIDFIIPAKSTMSVREDALSFRAEYENRELEEWKYGKDKCKGFGVNGLLSYFEYSKPNTKNNKKSNPSPINAIVVTGWRGKDVAPGKETVLLTSKPVENNIAEIAKEYRLRSLIENCCFRELKQATYLNMLPKRKGEDARKAVYMHILLCVFAHTLFYAFLQWDRTSKPENEEDENVTCMRKWRNNCNTLKILIIEGDYFATFDISELLGILGIKQRYRCS